MSDCQPPFELSLERLLQIVTHSDPEVRNSQITLAYSEMSSLIDDIVHCGVRSAPQRDSRNANWFTMATWAVATIGPNIRSRELPRRADRLLPGAVRAQVEPWILSLRSSQGRRVAAALEQGQVAVFLSTMVHAIWFVEIFVWRTLIELKTLGLDSHELASADLVRKLRIASRRVAACNGIADALEDPKNSVDTNQLQDARTSLTLVNLRHRLKALPKEQGGEEGAESLGNEFFDMSADEEEAAINEAKIFDLSILLDEINDVTVMRKALALVGITVDKEQARRIFFVLKQQFTYEGGNHLTDLVAAFSAYERASKAWSWTNQAPRPDRHKRRCVVCDQTSAKCKKDWKACADQARTIACGEVLRANLIITAVEQVLLDPAVTIVVEHVPEVFASSVEGNTAVWLEQVLRVPRTLGRLGAARRLKRTNEFIREGWARVLTDQVLVLSLPTELLRVGRDIPLAKSEDGYFFPARLRELSNRQPLDPTAGSRADQLSTEALFDLFDRSRGDGWGTGAWDWRRFDERMNFAVNLFRSRQHESSLFWRPYNDEDRERVIAGQVPLRFADPAAQNVVPTTWERMVTGQ